MLEYLFNIVAGLKTCNVIKKILQHSCFIVKLAKLLRTPFLTEIFRWLLWSKPRRSLWFIVWRSDALVAKHKSILFIQYHVKLFN